MKRALQFALLVLVVGIASLPAQAATINVAAGEVALNTNGFCSLREAIVNAETNSATWPDCHAGSGTDTIVLANSTYVLPDVAVSDGVYGDSGLPAVNSTITINGNGATIERDPSLFSGTACNGGTNFRIFYIGLSGNLTLNNLTLQNGCADFGATGAGGALFNRGALSLYRTTVTNNQAAYSGGAIHNDGTLTLTQSTVSNNDMSSGAGGGIVNRGTMTVVQSTINGNSSEGAGGGVDTGDSATATFANSTVSGNQSSGQGGGIFTESPTTNLTNATIAFNEGTRYAGAPGFGSGIYLDSGTTTLTNTLVANQVNGTNCYFSLSGGGNNLDDDGTCPTATVTANALIGPLANNGGPTLTHALLAGSPAIDAGNNSVCAAPPVNGLDQRGVLRPQFGGISNTCDIGAFELGSFAGSGSVTVPTLSEWAILLLVGLMVFLGRTGYMRRNTV